MVSIGTNAYKAQGGWNVVTGTVVQPGGFLSAMHMDIEADSIRAINDAFRVTRADGTVDADASAALVAQLKESLGLNYTEGTVADDIHTQFIKEKKGLGVLGQILAIAASVAISIATAGTGSMFAPLISGVLSSMVGQVLTTGTLNMGAALKAGMVSMVTAGLKQGALDGLSLGDGGLGTLGTNISTGSWTAVQDSLGKVIAASVVRSAINAGVNTIAYGGSFGQAFANGLIRDAAAVAANAVGIRAPGIGVPGSDPQSILANVLGHALVGCAAQSLSGGDCAGGAIGGAASAIAAPLIRDGLYAGSQTVIDNGDGTQTIKYGNVGYNATTVALATLIGGAAGALLGTNATAAALAAQNEALNNSTSDKVVKWAKETYKDPLGDLARWGKEFLGMLPGRTPPTEANPLVDATNGGNPPATGGAVVTPPTMSCSASGQCVVTPPIASPGAPGNAILSTNGGDAGGEPGQGANADSGAPGRVQSRINLTNAGMDHIGDRHLDPTVNASQFAISESDLTKLLQDKNTVSTPITRAIRSGNDINYVREVDTGQVVGTDKFNGYQPTSTMTVITDKYGNLVTAFPGRLE